MLLGLSGVSPQPPSALRCSRSHVRAACTAASSPSSACAAAPGGEGPAAPGAARLRTELQGARRWLLEHRNPDGGWGDTPDSPSNLPTTFLAWSCLQPADGTDAPPPPRPDPARGWLEQALGCELTPAAFARHLGALYGTDRTFAAPILMMGAINGVLGPAGQAWGLVPALPFVLALLPHGLFRHLRLGVVSYALPALIAVGLCRWAHAGGGAGGTPRRHPLAPRLLRRPEGLQPPHGGFLEAVPLSAFVAMALTSAGYGRHLVTRRSLAFVTDARRPDPGGGWPIDTNLDTWVTSLAVQACGSRERIHALLGGTRQPAAPDAILEHLLRAQTRAPHPYTQAAAGGWAWSALPGAVPDADDTAGALVALARLAPPEHPRFAAVRDAATRGLSWLRAAQNPDGGIPTFCRGWGRLPFDRSAADISAHALEAFEAWRPHVADGDARRLRRARDRCLDFLLRTQAPDGSWRALWFGDQAAPDCENPVFGTARVLRALHDCAAARPDCAAALDRGRRFLRSRQQPAGGWGAGGGSLEETGLALQALPPDDPCVAAARQWLRGRAGDGCPARPIGLYFARLWYAEALYPCVWALGGWLASDEPNGG